MTLTPTEARALLVAALTSGKYQQGFGSLRPDKNCYCALGVACDVYREHVGGEWQRHQSGEGFKFNTQPGAYDGKYWTTCVLPDAVRIWYGFKETIPVVGDGLSIADLNDGLRRPFKSIAQEINSYVR